MPFSATVVRVLIASPSDTANARRALREALDDWNSLHAETDQVMVLPVMWERDATPELGDRAQGVINRQLVTIADVLMSVFWTRLGTPTGDADSGTVEEIDRFIEADKPVIVYFSVEPVVPQSIDQEQYAKLVEFRQRIEQQGLVDTFENSDELRRKATAAITRTVRERFALQLAVADVPLTGGPRARPLARVTREREMRGLSKQGRPQYTTRERLLVENHGTATAEDFWFEFQLPDDANGELPSTFGNEERVARFAAGGDLDYPLMTHMGVNAIVDIVFHWREGDDKFEERQTVRV